MSRFLLCGSRREVGGRPQEGQEAQRKPIAIPTPTPARKPETPSDPGTGTRHRAARQLGLFLPAAPTANIQVVTDFQKTEKRNGAIPWGLFMCGEALRLRRKLLQKDVYKKLTRAGGAVGCHVLGVKQDTGLRTAGPAISQPKRWESAHCSVFCLQRRG